jgi:cell division protease FtsH
LNVKQDKNGKREISLPNYERYIKRLNSKNITNQLDAILNYDNNNSNNNDNPYSDTSDNDSDGEINGAYIIELLNNLTNAVDDAQASNAESLPYPFNDVSLSKEKPKMKIFMNRPYFNEDGDDYDPYRNFKQGRKQKSEKDKKSENFEVITNYPFKFKDIGGYENIKEELSQCVDILSNFTKYAKFNVRIPKGLILEGPPGNGKTLLAKALAGEAKVGFIPVSGAEFQDKYVGVGSSRVRELFALAKKNIPCIIFIDEIDAIGRKRSGDGETSSNERDNTLNQLLIGLDGFQNSTGVFLIGATNRIDLLDPALMRPGRVDKKIFIGQPDEKTRNAIINIHIRGKPHDESIIIDDLVSLTTGLSGAQIENVLNEAMLNALKYDRYVMTYDDIDLVMNKILAGWQPNDHMFTSNIIDHIAIHELGHAILGLISKHHSKLTKVVINLSSPNSPGYTVFEGSTSNIYTREGLLEHLSILLGGRIAEEIFYNTSVTTGAINDFEEAYKLAEKMVIYYGMGGNIIYPNLSEKYKEMIDTEVIKLINEAYAYSDFILRNLKDFIYDGAEILKRDKIIKIDHLQKLVDEKYPMFHDLKNNL